MKQIHKIDLNCDLGESYGVWTMGNDAQIMPFITSANIACGFHAGDFTTMRETVEKALEHNLAIGAHPSLPDRQGFGRRNMVVHPQEVYDMMVYQVGALLAFLKVHGGQLNHIKPHGALYQMATKDLAIAMAIAQAVADIGKGDVALYGLSGSLMIDAARVVQIPVMQEAFADRTYQADGSMTKRGQAQALILDSSIAVEQVLQMIHTQTVTAVTGEVIRMQADTICIHGDGMAALSFAREIHTALQNNNINLTAQ